MHTSHCVTGETLLDSGGTWSSTLHPVVREAGVNEHTGRGLGSEPDEILARHKVTAAARC